MKCKITKTVKTLKFKANFAKSNFAVYAILNWELVKLALSSKGLSTEQYQLADSGGSSGCPGVRFGVWELMIKLWGVDSNP